MQGKRLHFEEYVLDIDGGCLRHGDDELPLRPKSFDVLVHLAKNSQVLVSKEELFAAVWPGLAVTDDVLVQSISELRKVFGADGPRLIKTIPRRGYRFDVQMTSQAASTVRDVADAEPPPPKAPLPSATPQLWRSRSAVAIALLTFLAMSGIVWTFALQPTSKDIAALNSRDGLPVLAVLPFVSNGVNETHAYFADGLTQDVISALGRFPALTVLSWNAVASLKSQPGLPKDSARTLGARYHVEGQMHRDADRVRINAQLVDAGGRVLWSGRFDEALVDIAGVQARMTTEIAGALAIKVTQIEQNRAFAKPTTSLDAYDLFLRARPALQRPTRTGIVEARALLKRAIELDSGYAAAHAALAETYYLDLSMGWAQSPATTASRAEELALTALNIRSDEVRARVILGRLHLLHHRYAQARTELDRALEASPSDALALAGRGNVLMWTGQTQAAIAALETAQRLDPDMNAMDRFALSMAYYLNKRYAAAIDQSEINLRRTTNAHFSRIVLAAAYAQSGQSESAARALSNLHRMDPTFDAQAFGTKFLNPADLEHLRDGLRKASS